VKRCRLTGNEISDYRETYLVGVAPSPPAVQPLQIPKPLPLDWMKPQVDVMWANSGATSVAPSKRVSVVE